MVDKEVYGEIKEFAYFPIRVLEAFKSLNGDTGTKYQILCQLDEDYKLALQEDNQPRLLFKDSARSLTSDEDTAERAYFITSFRAEESEEKLVFSFVRNRNPDCQPWEAKSVLTESEFNNAAYIDLGNNPKDMLYNFAYWPSFLADLKTLKTDLALKENWSFCEDPSEEEFPILKNYITYTFSKLWLDKGVITSQSGQYCIFNTGLVNRNYQYIYALFEKNIGEKPWRFNQFCIPGIKRGGRILAENFAFLPKPAHYFNDISDVTYLISKDKTPDEQLPDLQPDHYFIDHPDRLPHHFLLDACRKNPEIVRKLNQNTDGMSKEDLSTYWQSIGEAISDDEDVYDELESAFRSAVRKAVMRVSWNYRTAIPVYFPTYRKMSILLPLTFSSAADAEVALVVEKNPMSQKYTAPTILNLKTAYLNARLVCKPESDWLNQGFFSKIQSDKMDEEVI